VDNPSASGLSPLSMSRLRGQRLRITMLTNLGNSGSCMLVVLAL